ncbi:MAG: PH domain-containing protein [Planctomycetota bacterium]|nr:PH domain-containing protein [Planctomycetota bacterium]
MPVKLADFTREEQDPSHVSKMFERVSQILMAGEAIEYIAVQSSVATPSLAPDGVVITTKRIIFYQPKLLGGVSFIDLPWRELVDAKLAEGMLRSTITVLHTSGRVLTMASLPKAQARKVYVLLQQREQEVKEERRQRELEDKRAAAGGVIVQSAGVQPSARPLTAPASAPADLMTRLRTLKEMKDTGLITAAEFDAKKAEIMSGL